MITRIIATLMLLSVVAYAQDNEKIEIDPKLTQVMCKSKGEVRTVRITTQGATCKAMYSKAGVEQLVAKSGSTQLCFEVLHRIKKNLEEASWTCKDISSSRVSNSIE